MMKRKTRQAEQSRGKERKEWMYGHWSRNEIFYEIMCLVVRVRVSACIPSTRVSQ